MSGEVDAWPEVPEIDRLAHGDVVPIPTLPPKYAFPVVVAPPDMVSPPFWLPLPMVDEAYAVSPPLNCVSVEVELPVPWNGYAAAKPAPVM